MAFRYIENLYYVYILDFQYWQYILKHSQCMQSKLRFTYIIYCKLIYKRKEGNNILLC